MNIYLFLVFSKKKLYQKPNALSTIMEMEDVKLTNFKEIYSCWKKVFPKIQKIHEPFFILQIPIMILKIIRKQLNIIKRELNYEDGKKKSGIVTIDWVIFTKS